MRIIPLQIAGLMTNLTQEYNNFLNFVSTTPSAIQTLINDATLLNTQLNAVSPAHLLAVSSSWRQRLVNESSALYIAPPVHSITCHR